MATLTETQVRHIAKLARLTLSEGEVAKFTTELTKILTYIDQLSEVDTKGVEAMSQVTGRSNSLREDVLRTTPLADPDALLGTTALSIVDHQIQTPSAHG